MFRARKNAAVLACGIFLAICGPAVRADDKAPAAPYSGEFADRSTLTGDWGGKRNDLANKGMTFDFSITQVATSVVDGGRSTGGNYDGRGDFLFNLDTGKAGLWEGAFVTVEVEGNWGQPGNFRTGALLPADSNAIYPITGEDALAVPEVSIAQFLSNHFGLFLGKIATVTQDSGDMNAFAHGKGDSQFNNLAFNFNPTLVFVPYSTLAAGAMIVPGKSMDDGVITIAFVDPSGNAGNSGFNTLGDSTMITAEGRMKTHFGNKTGHQLVGGFYSDKLYTSLDQDLRFILENRTLQPTSGAWAMYYNFDQYLYETSPGSEKGWGVFGRVGVSDGNPNPIKSFWSFGVGGNGLSTSRPNDKFGVGWYYMAASSANVPAFLGIGDEWGVEAYYNIALTPWAQLSPDIQYIDGAKSGVDPAVALALRLKLIF